MINVIGQGYIGLPTALMLAAHGQQVMGTDYKEEIIHKLNNGEITFHEKGLFELYERARKSGIQFSTDYISTDFYIIAVPTPYEKMTKKIDPSFVVEAFKDVLKVCKKNAIIVIESTISPKTIDTYIRPLVIDAGKKPEDVNIAHAPERIIPGNMVYELEHNSRTIGADSPEIAEKIKQVYSSFCQGEIVVTDVRTAEMTKVVENTFRDINIAYANELTKICRSDNLDVYEIIRIANKHPRVNILNPGPGVGGHCISVDPWFLVGDYPELANLILAARKINDSMPEFVLQRVADIMKEKGITDISRIGLYGLTYKANVDDVRESPTLQMLDCMARHLAHGVKIYDPYIQKPIVENQYFDFEKFINDVDFIVIMVGHNEIKENMDKIKSKIILDTCHVCDFPNIYRL